jgi:dTDP-4-amino-4,6-dideoxygalactose transaminase
VNPFSIVRDFERVVAEYAGSRYAVAVDTCTAAIHLCLEWWGVRGKTVMLPKRTYVSVPCAVIHAGGKVRFDDRWWIGDYLLDPLPVFDSACRFHRGMHVAGTFRCLSFQARKHVKIGRGGMILHDDTAADEWFRLARFSGRREVPLMDDRPTMVGWQCFMAPERAARGLHLMSVLPENPPDLTFDYPDLSTFGIDE